MTGKSQPSPPQKHHKKPTPTRSVWWEIIGVIFTWILVMACWQRGAYGYLLTFFLMYVTILWIFGISFLIKLFARFSLPMIAIGFLILWFYLGGTYSPLRDLLTCLLIVPLVLFAFPESRLWVKRLPRRLRARYRLRKINKRRYNSPDAVEKRRVHFEDAKEKFITSAKLWWAKSRVNHDANAPQKIQLATKRRLTPLVVTTCALAVWVGLSGLDYLLENKALPRKGSVLHPTGMQPELSTLNVGIALSGGGYRAALVHAGAIEALGQLGVPITHLSSVSGGSIIGSYLSVGGSPQDFLEAVATGRFRLTRDLMSAQNLVRLLSNLRVPWLNVNLFPFFDNFSRLDVQSDLIDRVLLMGATSMQSDQTKGPALMVCMTDLINGFSVGALNNGYLFIGPTTKRFFREPDAISLPQFTHLADRVAVSGSFPGAFPPLQVNARITTTLEPLTSSQHVSELSLLLADGGIRDNLGLNLLEAVDELTRKSVTNQSTSGWLGFSPPSDWSLDLILVSDGGQFFKSKTNLNSYSTIMRAIDLSGLETGVLRPMRNSSDRPLVVLSAHSTVAPSPDSLIYGVTQTERRDAHYQYFRPDTFDATILAKLVALVPDQITAQAALSAYQRLPADHNVDLATIDQTCKFIPSDSKTSPDCVWWNLVSLVGEDIWRSTEAFIATPTLSDSFSAEQAKTVYRFGQYMVFLKSSEIQNAVKIAINNKD